MLSVRLLRFAGLAFIGATFAAATTLPAAAESVEELYEAAKAEGELVLYMNDNLNSVQVMVAAFKEAYPGIKVDFFKGDTSQVMLRFETESAAGRHTVDLVTTTDRQAKQLFFVKGYTAAYRPLNLDMYPESLHAPENGWVAYSLILNAIAWNTDLVKGDEIPTNWQDLRDPKWRGRLGMQDPLLGGGAGIWTVTMYQLWGAALWEDWMQEFGAQEVRYGRFAEVREMLASGEIAIQLVAYPSFMQPTIDKGAPIEWGVIDSTLFTALSFNLSKFAQHPNAAKLFIEFFTSREGQQVIAGLKQIPALPDMLPPIFERIKGVTLHPQAHELETEKFDFFQGKMREYLVR
jgi:iron(III) transport system substrate-binding protein